MKALGLKGRSRGALAAVASSALLMLGACGQSGGEGSESSDDPISLRISSPIQENSNVGASVEWWKDEVEERTDGRIEVQAFHGGSMLAGTDTLEGVGDGRVEAGLTYNVYEPAKLPLTNVIDTLFVTDNVVAASQSLANVYDSNSALQAEYEELGVRPMVFVPNGITPTGTNVPLESIDDLQGLRLRVTGYPAEAFKAVEASSTFVEFAELYQSMERGVVDGWSGSDFTATVGAGLHEVTDFYTYTGMGTFAVAMIVMDEDVWSEIPDDLKRTIEEVNDEYASWIPGKLMQLEAAACDSLKEAGVTVSSLPNEEISRFQDRAYEPVLQEIRATALDNGVERGTFDAVFDEYINGVESYESGSDYTNGFLECVG